MSGFCTRLASLDQRVLIRGLVLIATLVAAGLLLESLGIKALFETAWIHDEVRGEGVNGVALFLLAGAAFTAFGLPRQVVAFFGGYAFGFVVGTMLALTATLASTVALFWGARFIAREFLERRFPDKVKTLGDFLANNTQSVTLVLRLSPLTNNLATNLAAGVSGAKPWPFFIGSALGYLPQTAIFALLGSGIALDPYFRIALSVALFAISTLLGLWLWQRYRVASGAPAETEERA